MAPHLQDVKESCTLEPCATYIRPLQLALHLVAETSSLVKMRSQLLRASLRSRRSLAKGCPRPFSSSARRAADVSEKNMVEITVDGKKVKIEAGSALIQACEKAGVTIPRYCYHE